MDCSMPSFPVLHHLLEFAQIHVHWDGRDAIQLSFYCSLLFLPSVFPGIRVFFSQSVLHIRWPKYWSSSFSISPSNENSGFISFWNDWFDLLAVQGTLKSLLQACSLKVRILQHWQNVSTGEGNGKPFQYSCLENLENMNSMKRQKDTTLKDELPRSVNNAQFGCDWWWK